ncbi:MAG: biotin--[acetyl-CoA-carboxylase] ligase [Prevotellaceae bacterium]|nr:biotin--[acetyl-CoA-carboxylase] ligase [Prevotellaceae bacterium]
MNIQYFTSLPSTNDKAMELLLLGGGEGTVVAARSQTAGRGQQNAAWESEAEKNLTFSIALCPNFLCAEQMFYLSKTVSLGVLDFLRSQNLPASIKWPNDIYVNDAKICGILIEQNIKGEHIANSVVGVGLNVNQAEFKHAPNATSLLLCDGKERNVEAMTELLAGCILKRYESFKAAYQSENSGVALENLDKEYLSQLYRRSGFFSYKSENEIFSAKILSVAPNGELILQRENGEQRSFWFKEVEFII